MTKAATKLAAVESEPAALPATPAGYTVTLPLTELKWGIATYALADITPEGLAYLIRNGWKQSIADSISGVQKQYGLIHGWMLGAVKWSEVASYLKMATPKDAQQKHSPAIEAAQKEKVVKLHTDACGDMELTTDEARALSVDDFAARLIRTWQDERIAAILAGTVGESGERGPRAANPLEAKMRDVAIDAVIAAARRAGLAEPKGAELTKLRNDYLAKYPDQVRKVAQRRLDEEAELPS